MKHHVTEEFQLRSDSKCKLKWFHRSCWQSKRKVSIF